MSDKQKSWLFDDVPVYKVGEGKKARWFAELRDDIQIEVKPVNGFTLWVLRRTYLARLPEPPILEMELEGVSASQRTRDNRDPEYLRQYETIMRELDAQITRELLKGILTPEGDDWAQPWVNEGRPLPPADSLENNGLRRDIYLAINDLTVNDRVMLMRVVQAISEETEDAISLAQEFFRYYMGRQEGETRENSGQRYEDEFDGRDDGNDASVESDTIAMVQNSSRGSLADDGIPAQQEHEGVPKRARRKGKA